MDERDRKIIVGQMKPHKQREWGGITTPKRRIKWDKRLLRKSIPLAAAFFCLGIAAVTAKYTEKIFSLSLSRLLRNSITMIHWEGCNSSAKSYRKARWSF